MFLHVLSTTFFPRASERRVLPIVGVCQASSHLHLFFSSSHLLIFTSAHIHILSSSHPHIFTSSHLHIFSSSHPHIFTSSHLLIFSSSHPHICSSSHLHILSCPVALLPSCPLAISFFSISLLKCQRDGTKRNPFGRNEIRSPKTAVKLRFQGVQSQPFRTK